MALILYKEKRVVFRVAYVGIPASGKATILKTLHRLSDAEKSSDFTHGFLDQDRVLWFDLKADEICVIPGFETVVRLITLPGYPTRTQPYRQILKGIDGLSFVVDSQWDRMPENVNAFAAIQDVLALHKTSLLEIPHTLLYNKRDLPNIAPLSYLDITFNQRAVLDLQAYEVQGVKGDGLVESLQVILEKLMGRYSKN